MAYIKVDDIDSKEIAPGFFGKFIHSDKITLAYWEAKKDAKIPLHTHPHEMMVNVIEGELELTVGNETQVLSYGTVAVVPGMVPHKATAVTDCKIIDVFYPVREDYK